MKHLKLITLVPILLFHSISTYAVEYQFVAADRSLETKICIAAVTNDIKKLKRLISFETHSGAKDIARSILCNDIIIANFAYEYQASDTVAYLDRYTSREDKKMRTRITIKDITAQAQGKPEVLIVAGR